MGQLWRMCCKRWSFLLQASDKSFTKKKNQFCFTDFPCIYSMICESNFFACDLFIFISIPMVTVIKDGKSRNFVLLQWYKVSKNCMEKGHNVKNLRLKDRAGPKCPMNLRLNRYFLGSGSLRREVMNLRWIHHRNVEEDERFRLPL